MRNCWNELKRTLGLFLETAKKEEKLGVMCWLLALLLYDQINKMPITVVVK